MQPMTSMRMSPGNTCQTSSNKHHHGHKGGGSCHGKDGGKTDGNNGTNGDDNKAATTYLQNLQQALQQGVLPELNALVSNFPVPLNSQPGQQLLGQVSQLLSQAGEKGQALAKQLPSALQQAQMKNPVTNQGGMGQQNRTLINDPTSGSMGSFDGSDVKQLTQAIYVVFSQLFQLLKSPSANSSQQPQSV